MTDNDAPLGFCTKCRMAKINQGGVRICPNCDTKTGTKSGLVNKFEDPGNAMALDGKLSGPVVGGVIKTDGQTVMGKAEVTYPAQIDIRSLVEPVDEVGELVDRIDNLLSNMKLSDFSDLREARKVMKYRKKLATLKLELQEFLG